MNDKKYLLSITQLSDELTGEQLTARACGRLDRERLRKVQALSNPKKRAECIGAGLLLQLGLQEMTHERQDSIGECAGDSYQLADAQVQADNASLNALQPLTVLQVLDKLIDTVEAEYVYSEKGKPYFKNLPIYFSISHSGDYVFCIFSAQEVGADIQYRKPGVGNQVMQRFFAEEEKEAWKQLADPEEREKLFYRLWTRKEAYGKLTGEGIVAAASTNALAISQSVFWEEYELPEDYQIAVCKRTEEKE